jgi:hypothetical protein
MNVRKALMPAGLLALVLLVTLSVAETPETALAAAGPADALAIDLMEGALVSTAAGVTAEKVCRGKCTYESGPTSTFSTPCNSSCACDATVNGYPLYQYSCGYVSAEPHEH